MTQIPYWQSRTALLLGNETLQTLHKARVLVVGLGGVGGICAEMIARSGVGHLTIADGDTVDLSNCNRQIAALHSTKDRLKTDVLAQRIKDINPDIDLKTIDQYLKNEQIDELLDTNHWDYVVDCIDTLSPKIQLLKGCIDRNIRIASAMGAGGKTDPSLIKIADISQSYNCTLARYVRKKLNQLNIKTGIKVVFSPQDIDHSRVIETDTAFNKKSVIGTIGYMPALFGCMLASVVIRDLCPDFVNQSNT